MDGAECDDWLQEAVLEYLQSPLYEGPILTFIDDRCLIFDDEEENLLEYTEVHEEFKTLVDELLTTFLLELGVPLDVFCDVLSSANTEKLNSVVIDTILTVDDFVHFKATMLKRNLELTNQVLDNLELPRRVSTDNEGSLSTTSPADKGVESEEKETFSKGDTTKSTTDEEAFQALGIDDDDPDLAWAIAESLRESCANRLEIAELEQAIALSLAVGDNHVRAGESRIDRSDHPYDAGPSSPFPSCEVKDVNPGSSQTCKGTIGDQPGTSADALEPPGCSSRSQNDYSAQSGKIRDGKEPVDAKSALVPAESTSWGANGGEPGKVNAASRRDRHSRIAPAKGSKAVRAAAVEAAEAQKSVLVAQKELADKKMAQGAMLPVPHKQREWIKEQRKKLVNKTNAARKQDMEEYCQRVKDEGRQDDDPSDKGEVDIKRAELRNRLANKFKLDLAVRPRESSE